MSHSLLGVTLGVGRSGPMSLAFPFSLQTIGACYPERVHLLLHIAAQAMQQSRPVIFWNDDNDYDLARRFCGLAARAGRGHESYADGFCDMAHVGVRRIIEEGGLLFRGFPRAMSPDKYDKAVADLTEALTHRRRGFADAVLIFNDTLHLKRTVNRQERFIAALRNSNASIVLSNDSARFDVEGFRQSTRDHPMNHLGERGSDVMLVHPIDPKHSQAVDWIMHTIGFPDSSARVGTRLALGDAMIGYRRSPELGFSKVHLTPAGRSIDCWADPVNYAPITPLEDEALERMTGMRG